LMIGSRMKSSAFIACFLLFASVSVTSAQTEEDTRSLGDVARETRERAEADAHSPSAHSVRMLELIGDLSVNSPEDYNGHISELLNHRDFDGLEKAADSARSNKSRLPGGAWKLYNFYQTVSKPSGDGRRSSARLEQRTNPEVGRRIHRI